MFSALTVLKILAVATTTLNPKLISEISEIIIAVISFTESLLNNEKGDVKKEKAIKLLDESLDIVFINYNLKDEQKTFIKEKLVPNLIDLFILGLNKLNFFGKKEMAK